MIPVSYNVRSMLVRKTTTIATALGIGLVVFVLAAAVMLWFGIKKTMVGAGRNDNAVVLRKGSDNEMSSSIEIGTLNLVLAAPGIKRDASGPIGAGEIVVVIAQDKIGTAGQVSNILVRGTTERSLKTRPEIHVVDGRPPQPGTDEVMIGKGLVGNFAGMQMGSSFDIKKNRPVKVVGVFESGGSSFESEVWADLDTARSSFGREGLVSSVIVRLDSAAKFDAFRATMESDKQLGLETLLETKYYEKQSEGTSIFILALGIVISVFFAAGATFGAVITMYAAVSQRQREIGTLRALGFSRFSIMFSFLLESCLLALAGGVLGAAVAFCLGFVKISMMNFQTWQEISFSFDPNLTVLAVAIAFAVFMGLVGGIPPAWRASRVSPVEAMRGA